MTEETFKYLHGRLSTTDPSESFIHLDTNPDSPDHYLYKRFIDPETKSPNYGSILFRPSDNPYFSKERLAEFERDYPPGTVWFRRFILGEWCNAEGSIWPNFTKEYIRSDPYTRFQDMNYVGIDFGYHDEQAVVLHSVTADNVLVARDEYHAPGRVQSEHWPHIVSMLDRNHLRPEDCTFIYDRSGLGYANELRKAAGEIHLVPSRSENKLERCRRIYAILLAGGAIYNPKCRYLLSNIRGLKFKVNSRTESMVGEDHAFDAHLYAAIYADEKHKLLSRKLPTPPKRDDEEEEENWRTKFMKKMATLRP